MRQIDTVTGYLQLISVTEAKNGHMRVTDTWIRRMQQTQTTAMWKKGRLK